MNTTSTLNVTPEVLRALAAGLDRLNDGDEGDRAQADAVALQVFQAARLAWDGHGFCPASEATHGYVEINGAGVYAYQTASGAWSAFAFGNVEEGTRLYFDEACTLFMRNV